MNKNTIYVIPVLILYLQTMFGQSVNPAASKAKINYEKENYTFHSLPFSPAQNSYLEFLKRDYGVSWRFVDSDSIDYYERYDQELTKLLKTRFGNDFLELTKIKADSLEKRSDWNSLPEFKGGEMKMLEYVFDRLTIKQIDNSQEISTKVLLSFVVSQTGALENIVVLRGIREEIDNKIIRIFAGMPNWEPGYRFGEPVEMKMMLPMIIEFK